MRARTSQPKRTRAWSSHAPKMPRGRARRLVAACFGLVLLGAAAPGQTPPTAPAADPVEGRWTGTIAAPQGTPAEIGFEFFRTQKGTLVFRMNFPEMFTYAVPFMIPVEADGHGGYAIVPAFDIHLQRDGDRLTGTFGAGRLPLDLHRGGVFAPKPPPAVHPAGPAPKWQFDLGAGTWAPPVVADGIAYVGTSAGRFVAVRAADGTAVWSWTGANAIDGRAVVDADAVYFVDTRCQLVALARSNGALCWSTPLHDEKIAGQPAPDNPTFNHRAATPLVADGVVYCGSSDGGIYAVEATTGAKLWRHDAHAPVFSGIGRHGADTLMFGTMDGSVVLLNRRTRQETLRVKTGGGVVTTPVVVGDTLIAGSRDYLLYGFKLADGSLVWRYSYWFSWVESTPAVADGLIYVGASDYSRVTALDPATGRARWSTPVHGMNWGTPLVVGDQVFTGTAAQNLPGTVIEHTGGILALDRRSGSVRWQLVARKPDEGKFGGYAGSLAVAGDVILAAGFDGRLLALPLN